MTSNPKYEGSQWGNYLILANRQGIVQPFQLHEYYSSRDREPLSTLAPGMLQEAVQAISVILESSHCASIMARLIEGYDPQYGALPFQMQKSGGVMNVSKEALLIYFDQLKDYRIVDLLVDFKILEQLKDQSRSFEYHQSRLLEIVCYAIHDVAKQLHETFHPPPPIQLPVGMGIRFPSFVYPGEYHFHHLHDDELQTVGFWAEGAIFGGVIEFDRQENGEVSQTPWLYCQRPPTQAYLDRHHEQVDWDKDTFVIPREYIAGALEFGILPFDFDISKTPGLSRVDAGHGGVFREYKFSAQSNLGVPHAGNGMPMQSIGTRAGPPAKFTEKFEDFIVSPEEIFKSRKDEAAHALADWQMQMMLREPRQLRRLLMPIPSQLQLYATPTAQGSTYASSLSPSI